MKWTALAAALGVGIATGAAGQDFAGSWTPSVKWIAMIGERWGLSERLDVQLEKPPLPEKPRVRPVMEQT